MASEKLILKDPSGALVARLVGRKQPQVKLLYAGRELKRYGLPGLRRRCLNAEPETLYTGQGYVHLSSETFGDLYRWAKGEILARPTRVAVKPGLRSRPSALAERLFGPSRLESALG